MGMGFRKSNKKTAKALDNELAQLEAKVRNAVMVLQMQLSQIGQKVMTLSNQAELIDFRSLATLKLLVKKGQFTNEEHEAFAELVRIDAFNAEAAQDTANRKLTATTPETVLSNGLIYVAKVDAFEPATITTTIGEGDAAVSSIEPNPNVGKKIDALSMLRMKMTFGSGEFPKFIEDQFSGLTAGATKSFSLECPKEFGDYAGKKVDFTVTVFEILQAPAPVSAATEPVSSAAPVVDPATKLKVVKPS